MPAPIEPLTSIFVFAFGLILGSFLNVCIHRLPLGESIVHPRSRCPSCRRMIAWYDNLPVLSWIFLRGTCRHCRVRIPVRYPAVELITAVIVVALWRFYGPTAEFAIGAGFVLAMLVLFFTDWDHQLLPDAITLTGFATGIAVAWFNPFLPGEGLHRVWMALAGAALGSGVLWGIGAIYGRLRGVEAMGLGDVKMMALVGAFSGPQGVLFTIFAGSMVGAVIGILLIPVRGGTLQDKLPFGCFLAPAAVAALFWARPALDAYLELVLVRS